MSAFTAALPTLLALGLTLSALIWLGRQLSFHLQTLAFRLSRSPDFTTLFLFIVLLPGIFIHESAHWLAAKLMGLKTGTFRVWPKRQGKQIALGSVSVERGNRWQESFVGVAPLLVGSLLVVWIGQQIFDTPLLSATWRQGHWLEAFTNFWQAIRERDGALWGYLLFTVANAMIPSEPDREPFPVVVLYMVLAVTLYFVFGLPLAPFASALAWLTPRLGELVTAFVLTIVLDGLILLPLVLINNTAQPSAPPPTHKRVRRQGNKRLKAKG